MSGSGTLLATSTPTKAVRSRRIGVYLQAPFDDVGGAEYEALVLAEDLSREHDVEIVHHKTIDLAAGLERRFDADLSRIGMRCAPPPPSWGEYLRVASAPAGAMRDWLRSLSGGYDVFVPFCHDVPPWCYSEFGVLRILFPYFSKPESWPWKPEATPLHLAPRNAVRRWFYDRRWKERMAGYAVKVANSEYTRAWTERLWDVPADVVYPPVDRQFAVRDKEPLILVVGRICGMKRQLELVQAFRELGDLHTAGWRLCVAGSVSTGHGEADYFDRIRTAARDAPVDLATNVDGATLTSFFERASLFWHGAGMGVDAEEHPAEMEHFGIATVEAMRAGCVPVVINRGGQTEIVRPGVDGYLWNSADELKEMTRAAAADASHRATLAHSARERAEKYSRKEFVDGFRRRMKAILSGAHDSYL